jgi:hypothetical protein
VNIVWPHLILRVALEHLAAAGRGVRYVYTGVSVLNCQTNNSGATSLSIELEEGTGFYMGDGMFVLHQRDGFGRNHSVTVSAKDLETLQAAA